jgi:Tol biopolymer transport system component
VLAAQGFDAIRVIGPDRSRTVPDTRDIDTFEWARDGKGLLLTTRDGELWHHDLATGARKKLTGGFRRLRFPEPSPDGRSIVFAATNETDPAEGWALWICGQDGSRPRKLVEPGYGPSWSADGQRVYYEWMSKTKENTRALFVVEVASGQSTPFLPELTEDSGPYSVKCSPDGKRIGFCYRRSIHVYRTGDGAVAPVPGNAEGRFCSFSADGSRIAILQGSDVRIVDLTTGADEYVFVHGDEQMLAYFERRILP